MRIVFISPEYPPAERMGGIGTNAATMARALARRGHEVGVVTRGEQDVAYEDEGVRVQRLHHRWLPNPHAQRLLANGRIARTVRRLQPDLVQAAEWEGEAWWLARWTRTRVITRLATPTYLVEELNYGTLDRSKALVRFLERDQTRRSDAVYAPTRAMAQRVAGDWGIPAGAIEVIPNSIDVAGVRRAGASDPPIDLPDRFVVFLGRLERRKGIEELAQALPEALGAHPDVHAIVIGRDPREEGGALMERVHRWITPVADRVHLLGELPRDDALAVVARAELSLVPSRWENFGYVCVEAMALGVPVVAARAGGLVEIVREGRDGWLVPPGRGDALGKVVAQRLGDRDELGRAGKEAERRAEDFEVAHIARRLEDLFERVAGAGSDLDHTVYRRGYRRYFRADDRRDPFHKLYGRKRDVVLSHFARAHGKRILDAGGGYGRLAAPLAERHDVVLCDISSEMLLEASSRCPDGVQLVQADARALPFPSEGFDAVLALDLLVHLPDLTAAVSELARVVRGGGEVVFDTTNAAPWWVLAYPSYWNFRPKRLALTLRAGGVLPEWRTLVRHQRPAEVRAALAAAGLELESVQRFGPPGAPKWHLWRARKRAGA